MSPGTPAAPALRWQDGRATLPATACFWALLDSTWAGRTAEARRFQAEGLLPLALEQLQTAEHRLDDGRTVVVAIPQAWLEGWQADLAAAWHLTPERLPAWLAATGVDDGTCSRLNLLHGRWLARPRRRLQRLTSVVLLVCLAVSIMTIIFGTARRLRHLESATQDLLQRTDRQAEIAARPGTGAQARLPARTRLLQEHRELQAAEKSGRNQPADLIPVVESCCSAWPPLVRVQVERWRLAADRIELRGSCPDLASAERLHQALDRQRVGRRIWRCAPLQVQMQGQQSGFSLLLTPAAEESP